jgi:cellobiose phosphorylase
VLVLLGQGLDAAEARALVAKYRARDLDEELAAVRARWTSCSARSRFTRRTGRSISS